ncbi:hypothetical protein O181_009747 [Austropuccinia psidii MF-1]|uniref:Uncharacterized protein n=1 Tax=Austropuccinia psidii MF-1 TaxID=1389203 RepID=A0A9Q3BRA8_9BASI|nr:hypothetical protein [Austropuccinia psidii MF-1]
MPHKQTLQQLTTGPSGMQWAEDLFQDEQPPCPFLIWTFASSELILPPFVEPSQNNELPIPGPSQTSDSQLPSHENDLTCGPEPEVALRQSLEEPFGQYFSLFFIFFCYQIIPIPPSKIFSSSHHSCSFIINDTPVGTPLLHLSIPLPFPLP